MLTRRSLRIKVMQALYGYFQSDSAKLSDVEMGLKRSIDVYQRTYISLLALLPEIAEQLRIYGTDKSSLLASNQSERLLHAIFFENPLIHIIQTDEQLDFAIRKHKIGWQHQAELVRKLASELRASERYQEFIRSNPADMNKARFEVAELFIKVVLPMELLDHHLEDENIYWTDNKESILMALEKTVTQAAKKQKLTILPPYKDEDADEEFMKVLLRKTIENSADFESRISAFAKNWESDRIATVDMILMKMALAEVLYCSEIPVKVSINEYIDISKVFSSPKSKIFVNGVLDKVVTDLKKAEKIHKVGRGLIN